MKVLLTGHSGFIGQHLLKILIKKKINLYVTKYNNLKIPENNRGLRNGLANEILHEKMVEEQYKEGFGR